MSKTRKGRVFMRVVLALALLAILGETVLACLVYGAARKAYPDVRADVAIVLGARVHPDGRLSLTLSRRTEKAFEAYEKGLVSAFILCGGQGSDEPMTEADAMAGYMTELGVPREKLYLEDKSTSTFENLAHARAIMEEQGMQSALVVTSDYHMTRALWLCRDAGMNASGYPSKGPDALHDQIKALAQEGLSWVKYALNRLFAG